MKTTRVAAIAAAVCASVLFGMNAQAQSIFPERTNPLIQRVVKRSATSRTQARGNVEGRITAVQESGGDTIVTLVSGEVLRARSSASVFYRGERFDMSDLEVGDVIRANVTGARTGELAVRNIEVIRSVSDTSAPPPRMDDDERGMVMGEVVSVNPRNDSFLMMTRDGRSIRVDAYHSRGVDLTQLQDGDRVSVAGTFDPMGVLRATRIDRGTRGMDRPRIMRREERRERVRGQRRNSDDDDDDDEDEDED
jgi:hypothetical protein